MSELSETESVPDFKLLLPSKTPTKPSLPQPILPSSPPLSPLYGFASIESISDEEDIAQTDPMQQPLPHCAPLPVPPLLDRAHGDGVPPNTVHLSDATSVSKPSLNPQPLLPSSHSSSPSPVSPGQQPTKGGSQQSCVSGFFDAEFGENSEQSPEFGANSEQKVVTITFKRHL